MDIHLGLHMSRSTTEPIEQETFIFKDDGWQEAIQQSSSSPITTIRLLSWNIDFQAQGGPIRMAGALHYLEELITTISAEIPVIIFLQEMVANDLKLIKSASWIRSRFAITDVDPSNLSSFTYGTTTLTASFPSPACSAPTTKRPRWTEMPSAWISQPFLTMSASSASAILILKAYPLVLLYDPVRWLKYPSIYMTPRSTAAFSLATLIPSSPLTILYIPKTILKTPTSRVVGKRETRKVLLGAIKATPHQENGSVASVSTKSCTVVRSRSKLCSGLVLMLRWRRGREKRCGVLAPWSMLPTIMV